MTTLSLSNQFLIAMPTMQDPLFAKSVVYICEHGEHGAMGVIINKPSGIALAQLFEQINLPLEQVAERLDPVLFGGPVQPDRGFVLHSPIGNWQSTLTVTDDVALTTSKDVLMAVAEGDGPEHMLVTLGYAGWNEGQLEQEMADNTWINLDSDAHVLFGVPAEQRYAAAVALLGFDPALLSGQAGHA